MYRFSSCLSISSTVCFLAQASLYHFVLLFVTKMVPGFSLHMSVFKFGGSCVSAVDLETVLACILLFALGTKHSVCPFLTAGNDLTASRVLCVYGVVLHFPVFAPGPCHGLTYDQIL